ncbi:hypothetical protein ACWDTT_15760 [Streptosporangium sandarakinum]
MREYNLGDKKRRQVQPDSVVVPDGSVVRHHIDKMGAKYLTLRPYLNDEQLAGDDHVIRVEASTVTIVKLVDGEWVDDWDVPRPKPGRRIAWGKNRLGTWVGSVKGTNMFAVEYGKVRGESTHYVSTSFPGYDRKMWPCASRDAGEQLAEKLLELFVNKLGAVFPE